MRAFLATIALGTPRDEVRAIFVDEGEAGLYEHPERPNIEKYIYDINLCQIYVWRWNISANYSASGELTQIFMNGEAVYPDGDAPRHVKETGPRPGVKQTISKGFRPRPEASLGENKIAFILFDLNSATDVIDDEFVMVAGPSRADPANLGKLHAYADIERWRSIVDNERAPAVVNIKGGCRPV